MKEHPDAAGDTHAVPERIYRAADLPEVTGYCIPHIYDLMAAGQFPKPVPLGARAKGWLASEIVTWQRQRIAQRDCAMLR